MIGIEKATVFTGVGGTRSTALTRARAPQDSLICDELVGSVGYTKQANQQAFSTAKLIETADKKFAPIERTLLSHELLMPLTLRMAQRAKHCETSLRRPLDTMITRLQQEDGKKIPIEAIKKMPAARAEQMTQLLTTQYIDRYAELLAMQEAGLDCLVVDTTFVRDNLFSESDDMKVVNGSYVHTSREGEMGEVKHQLYYSTYDTVKRKGVVKAIDGKDMRQLIESRDHIERAVASTKEKSLSRPGLDISDDDYITTQNRNVAAVYAEIDRKSERSSAHAELKVTLERANAVYLAVRRQANQSGQLRTSVYYSGAEAIAPDEGAVLAELYGRC